MNASLLIALCLTAAPVQDGTRVIENGQQVSRAVTPPRPLVLDNEPIDSVIWPARERPLQEPLTAPATDDRDVVFFAADSVEFKLPYGWNVQETPWLRDVYLQLGPQAQFSRDPHDLAGGVWLKYRPERAPKPNRNLQADLNVRLQAAVATMPRIGEPQTVDIGGYTGLLQEFSMPLADGTLRPAAHLVVITQWGVFELRAMESGPNSHFASVGTSEILKSLQFHSHAPGIGMGKPPQASATAATPIFGSWKAINGRMQILRDGRLALELDRKQVIRFDESGYPKFRDPNVVIIGRYDAKDDLLQVTWEDGSQTNYRWDLQGENLLLTDHEGRVSQLAPVFD